MPEFNTKGDERAYGVYRATVTDTDDAQGGARVKVRRASSVCVGGIRMSTIAASGRPRPTWRSRPFASPA